MRRIILFLFGLIVSIGANADKVTEQQALQKAQQFMKGKNLTVSYSRSFARSDNPKDDQAFYIFNAENNGGFVIVSGDDHTPAILGFSDSGEFRTENMPDNVRYWLEGYATQINSLQQGKSYARASRTRGALPAIEPLIKTQWNQYEPYNRMCPMDGADRSITGCVAACAAQILYYYQWPDSSPSLPAYTTSKKNIDVPELPATTFNYDKMQTSYSWDATDNEPSRDEVAKLFRYCGQAFKMDYTADGSGAYLNPTVLKDVFQYTWRTREVYREYYSEEVWNQMMYDELKNNRPVPYSGQSEESGHQFILDGYKDELFHINWGWGGWCDGYFILSLSNPYQPDKTATDGGYDKGQSAIINLFPGKYEKKVAVGSLQYICDSKEETAAVVRGDYNEMDNLTEIIIPASITDNGITYQVTEIAEYTFNGLWNLKKIDLPSTLTAIGDHAFTSCSKLSTVICRMQNPPAINENVFSNTTWNQNEETGEYEPFTEFTKATLYVPEGCTAAYQGAAVWKEFPQIYEGELKEITVDGLNYSYVTGSKVATALSGDYQALENVTIPSTITVDGVDYMVRAIDNQAFQDCGNIKSLTLSKNLERIGYDAFYGCYNFEQLTIPEGVKTIGSRAFKYCSSVKKLELPSSLSAIGESAFGDISNLNAVVVAASEPLTINESVFSNTNWIKNVETDQWESFLEFTRAILYVPEGCTAAYQGADVWKKFPQIYEGELKEITVDGLNYSYVTGSKIATVLSGDYQALESVTIPSTITVDGIEYMVKAIDNRAFQDCSNIKSLTLSKNLERIGDYAFNYCGGIEHVTIPEGVKTIGSYAFCYCYSMKNLELPSSLSAIGEYAFGDSKNLNIVKVAASEPLTINESVFTNSKSRRNEETGEWESFTEFTKATLYVPEGSSAKYRESAGWKKFSPIYEGELKETTVDGLNYSYVTGSKVAMVIVGDYSTMETVLIPSTIIIDEIEYKVKAIENYAFNYCYSIKSLSLPDGLEKIGDYTFSGCDIEKLVIPKTVKYIGHSAFNSNYALTDIIIPEGVTTIGNYTFEYCNQITTVELPTTLTSLGDGAFATCTSLEKVVAKMKMPIDIQKGVFTNFDYVRNEETGEWETFSEFTSATLYVPYGKQKEYNKANGWKEFASIVEMEPTVGDPISITIGSSGKSTYCSKYDLDFSGFEDLKAYVATGYESDGTIWLTRIKQVPANTSVLIKGEAEKTYGVLILDKCAAYFENMFKGSTDEDLTISTTTEDGIYKNFYMSGGQFKPASESQTIKVGKCYLQVPASFKAAAAGENQTVKIADSGKSSYAPPVDVDLTEVEGLKAYAATGYDAASSTIWLTRINKIQAGEGVILKGEAGKEYTLPSAATQAYYGNMFVGNIGSKITINETSDDGEWANFYMAGGQFKKVSGTREIGTNKSYLHLPTSLLVSSARGKKNAIAEKWFMEELETETMLLGSISGEDDGTTRIDAIANNDTLPDIYYNLQGQRVDNPRKGLYIQNGRKVVIK